MATRFVQVLTLAQELKLAKFGQITVSPVAAVLADNGFYSERAVQKNRADARGRPHGHEGVCRHG